MLHLCKSTMQNSCKSVVWENILFGGENATCLECSYGKFNDLIAQTTCKSCKRYWYNDLVENNSTT